MAPFPAGYANEERLRQIIEAAPNAILVAAMGGTICLVNSQFEQLFGYSRAELLGSNVESLLPASLRHSHERAREDFSRAPSVHSMGSGREVVGLRRDGTEVPLEVGLSPVNIGAEQFVLASIVDISRRKGVERSTRKAEADALRESILNSMPASVIATCNEGRIIAVNPATERLLGYSRAELIGQPVVLIHDAEELRKRSIVLSRQLGVEIPPGFQVLVATGSGDTPDEQEWTYRRKGGGSVPVQVAITTLRDSSGKVSGFLKVAHDISARKRAEASIQYMATHDALTGLPNRSVLADRLRMAVRQGRRTGMQVAVLLLDLDQFKQVNDSLGHHVGDELLRVVAKRLKACVRDVDTVGRLGGDEFVIVVTAVQDEDDLTPLIGKIAQAISMPVQAGPNQLRVTPSIGGSLFPRDGLDAATLLKKADAAMYQAKAGGRGTFKWFTEEMMLDSREKLVLGTSLRQALDLNELFLHLQPKINLRAGRITGVEALLRWRHGDNGLVDPSRFIPIAEDTGLIVSLGEWALRQACHLGTELQATLRRPLTVAVNVSPRQFRHEHWVPVVRSALSESGLDARCLELEITEGTLMQNPESVAEQLKALRDLGVRIVIDDFGTGYSSLSYLTRLPVDLVKIDRSFVRDMTTDSRDAAVVNAILAMAKRLNIDVVAEGVETIEQHNHLVEEGCEEAQGYLYAQGLRFEELVARFEQIEQSLVHAGAARQSRFHLGQWIEGLSQD